MGTMTCRDVNKIDGSGKVSNVAFVETAHALHRNKSGYLGVGELGGRRKSYVDAEMTGNS